MTARSFFQTYSPSLAARSSPSGMISPCQPIRGWPEPAQAGAAAGTGVAAAARRAAAKTDFITPSTSITWLLLLGKGKQPLPQSPAGRARRGDGSQTAEELTAAAPPPSSPGRR